MVLVGCKSVQPLKERIVIKSDTVRTIQKDSVYLFVSDTVHLFTKNDTVYQNTIKWRIQYREGLKTDTIIKNNIVTVNNTKVVAKMNKFQEFFFTLGILLSLVLVIALIIRIIKVFK